MTTQPEPRPEAEQPIAPILTQPYAPEPPRGVLPWALGFISWLPIPFVGTIAGAIAMAVAAPSQRRKGGLAAANATAAANWGLTVAALTVALIGLAIAVPAIATGGQGGYVDPELSAISFMALGFWGALAVAHAIVVLVGVIRATQGRVTRPWAIRFLRAPAA